ncbi:Na+/H+ antiporter NhaC family protein [Nitrosococcus watsonii]|uniref:Na+/H+ antiporter NhaC-like protein n=1 Tax=Nitrosococcus watsoni (strain C-113) TaxID=105559 RepID=D8K4S1_NITWC|nr:Na+/H+ antiporter NhaC family protein [Nitrosococcus watsonii]ADJ27898.1 Na+/H+ antiporter NhaC-like protein [Nitrosococcus watsonii C-113]
MGWITLLPALAAILIGIWKREVILSLLVALYLSETLLAGNNPALGFIGLLERITAVFQSQSNTQILLFSILVGALLIYMNQSGGVSACVQALTRVGFTQTPRRVGLLTAFVGVAIFIESNMSMLVAGILSRPLFDKFRMSRARLAYFVDSTCAPVSILILLNGWGAYLLGLLTEQGFSEPITILVMSIPLNFYALITLALVFYTAIVQRVYGPLRSSEKRRGEDIKEEPIAPTRVRYMLLPLLVMVSAVLFFLGYTGNGDLLAGSGSSAIFWGTALATLVAYFLLLKDRVFSHQKLITLGFEGMGKLLPVVTTVLLALALSASMGVLGTGKFVAQIVGSSLPPPLIPVLVFIAAGLISFTTGTSWGTFGIMIPIALPLAQAAELPPALILSALLGGGVFGDHCSPISDTTLISSLAAGCDHLEHIQTQLPYALSAAGVTLLLYFVTTWLLW